MDVVKNGKTDLKAISVSEDNFKYSNKRKRNGNWKNYQL